MNIGDHQQSAPIPVLLGLDATASVFPATPSTHSVQFYEQDEALIDRLSEFAGSALGGGHPCVVVLTPAHRGSLCARLIGQGIDVDRMIEDGRFVVLDAAETLQLFMVDGVPIGERFFSVIGGLLSHALGATTNGRGRLAVFGEMVALLFADGNAEAAIRLEQLWNELSAKLPFSLLCAYPMGGFARGEDEAAFRKICSEHSHVMPCESYGKLPDEAARLLIVSELQQKAQMLLSELERRKTAEQALRKSEEFSRSIVESSVDCIKVLDAAGRLIYISPPGLRVLGIADADSVLNKRWVDFWAPEDQERAAAVIAAAQKGDVGRFEGSLTRANAVTWWDVTIAPMFGEDGTVERLLAISRESTEMKLAQSALMQSEKLAAAGRLAATVAHEINNPLEAVTNFIYLAKTSDGLPEDVHSYLEVADQELARVGHIAQQTLGFYRDTSNPRSFDVRELVQSVVAVYERKMRYKNLSLDQQLDSGISIFARKGDLKQVLSNLLTNAIDATPDYGRIVLRTRRANHCRTGTPGVRIIVADSGTGMSAATQAKAFSAFFTTKEDVGTGIGLWVTKNILERWGGSIQCRSSQGAVCGTAMSIFLPLECL
ncbi:MAG TPA: MEDS domain-containing protein [Acidobacteriaceae bacterium]|nr:MEDS domain-containing protein [Acidobacteriaceae bacterium]